MKNKLQQLLQQIEAEQFENKAGMLNNFTAFKELKEFVNELVEDKLYNNNVTFRIYKDTEFYNKFIPDK